MKAVLLQLPVQSHDCGYSLENIPLASGYLQASAVQRFGPGVEVEICPPGTASLGGDAAILEWVLGREAEIAGFSCSLWNIERSLALCRMIRERAPGMRIVLGGPEISPDNGLLKGAAFDAAVAGEGEEAFLDLLEAWGRGAGELSSIPGLLLPHEGGVVFTGRRTPLPSLDGIPSPYLCGALDASYTGTIFLETVRGCVYQCSYCSYHKQFKKLRRFDLGRTAAEVRWALNRGVEEISFIDPCFAMRPGLDELLGILEDAQRVRPMKISCELNAEDLDRDRVERLVRAGVRHVEIGLQSTNRKALDLCSRRFDEGLFTRGVRMLMDAGVEVTTDIMVGLPGDALGDVRRSLDFVLDNGLFTTLNLYPVSVLPGTLLRERAQELGVRHQDLPPYYVVSTPDMGPDDIREAFARAEALTGESYFPVELPRAAGDPPQGAGRALVSRIVVTPGNGWEAISPASVGMALAVEIADPGWLGAREAIRRKLRPLLEANPYTLLSWIVPEEYFDPGEALPFLAGLARRAPHPCDREYMGPRAGSCSSQVFIRSRLEGMGDALTLVPPAGSAGDVEVFLPVEAGRAEEDSLSYRLKKLLGVGARVRFNDLPS